ncbi:U2-associated protein [Schizosaccharomyces japonicus yFS275]|uniref:U2-associated protein n=1 Tax=Schizosaccharomyces japonicus (strain yFS275 / FY16936) TaxID=402676 RepID=B6K5V3_SCHJY|nr:U2-associated protein [Schizosaccharomyces japonicus yFS275]EEB08907.1 U2-associated protein [Schizosaccharomyces japonicus yFS275]
MRFTERKPLAKARRHFAKKEFDLDESDDDEDTFLRKTSEISDVDFSNRLQEIEHKSTIQASVKTEGTSSLHTKQSTSLCTIVHLSHFPDSVDINDFRKHISSIPGIMAVNIFPPQPDSERKGILVVQNEAAAFSVTQFLKTNPFNDYFIQGTYEIKEPKTISNGVENNKSTVLVSQEQNSISVLSPFEKAKLNWLLDKMSCSRSSIARAMAFSMEHVHCHEEIVDQITNSFLQTSDCLELDVVRKLSHLYLFNDILYNCASGIPQAWKYRLSLEKHLRVIFEHLRFTAKRFSGRLKENIFTQKVLAVTDVWTKWVSFREELFEYVHNLFNPKTTSSTQFRPVENETALEDEKWFNMTPPAEELENDEEYNGIPVDVSELLGLKAAKEETTHEKPEPSIRPAMFKQSFTKGTVVSKKMRMRAEDLFDT